MKNWKDEDWGTWRNDRIWEHLKKRNGATCNHSFHYVRRRNYNHNYDACLCEDNTQNAF
jgi:hypothetical protein